MGSGERIVDMTCDRSHSTAAMISQRPGDFAAQLRTSKSDGLPVSGAFILLMTICHSQRIAIKPAPRWSVTSFSSLKTATKLSNPKINGTTNNVPRVIHRIVESIRCNIEAVSVSC